MLPGLSGVRMLVRGEEALAALLLLADGAQRTLDLQYYAVLNDVSARVLMQRVLAAADRGVRVRLLVDDFNTSGTDDALRRLAHHPRIEVRLYNPLPSGRMSTVTKVLASLHDAARINSRMHNKAFIADNAIAVTGGRNIGDSYFLQTEAANFVDLDVLVAGPVVPALSTMFDRFWNSDLAYPADAVIPAPAKAASAPSGRRVGTAGRAGRAARAGALGHRARTAPMARWQPQPAVDAGAPGRRLAEQELEGGRSERPPRRCSTTSAPCCARRSATC